MTPRPRLAVSALLAFIALGCGDDAGGPRDAGACTPGDTVECACITGGTGEALCGHDGRPGACSCEVVRTVPCSAPGASFVCTCDDGARGSELCLDDGDYSGCVCDRAGHAEADGGSEPTLPTDAGSTPAAISCPSPFSCTTQMGYDVCAEGSGLPPFCEAASDCASAGLPAADCVDPGVGGVKVCVQICQR